VFTAPVIEAVFAPDSVQSAGNTKAIEIGNNTLVSVRVLDYHAAAPIPLEIVKPTIKDALQRAAAAEMARTRVRRAWPSFRNHPATMASMHHAGSAETTSAIAAGGGDFDHAAGTGPPAGFCRGPGGRR